MTDRLDIHVTVGGRSVKVGEAFFTHRAGGVSTHVRYGPDYLGDSGAYPLDPSLPLDAGGGFASGLPGSFQDCAPDRWGRMLVQKRLRASGLRRDITEVDYLLGVADATRQGALQFTQPGAQVFLADSGDIPRTIRLPELLAAADAIENDNENLDAIKALLNHGTGTLGGARPKASVIDDDGRLMIAKFPRQQDPHDVMAWEKTALDLAERAGIAVPTRRLVTVDGRSVLLVDRFDRTEDGQRIGYISFMTLTSAADGSNADYLDLAEELGDVSANPDDDLPGLWRRVAFSVAINNTDDHLRNHGLLRSRRGWRLSPAFDINPNPDADARRVTTLAYADSRDAEYRNLVECSHHFLISRAAAAEGIEQVREAVSHWREVAARNGIDESEMRRFAGAFGEKARGA